MAIGRRQEERQSERNGGSDCSQKTLSFVKKQPHRHRFDGAHTWVASPRCNYADLEKLVNLEDNQPAEMQARTRRAGSTEPIKFPYVRGKLAR